MAAVAKNKTDDRLGALDGLRGLMAMWVLLGHTCMLTGFAAPVLDSPNHAVQGFMILSGFLMAYHGILRQDKEPWTSRATWLSFWIRRTFRISPLYYSLLPVAYLFFAQYVKWRTVVDHAIGAQERWAGTPPISVEHVVLHLTYLFGLIPRFHSSLVLPDWSLSLEMQFYFVFPLLMIAVLRFGWILLWVGSLLVWAAAHYFLRGHFLEPSLLPLSIIWFVVGMIWANAYLNRSFPLMLLGLGTSFVSRDPQSIALAACFAWILFAEGWVRCGNLAEITRNLLSNKFGVFLGDASYSVYLVHLLVLTPTVFLLAKNSAAPGLKFAIAAAITVFFSYSSSILLQRIERAGIRTGKQIAERLRKSQHTQVVLVS